MFDDSWQDGELLVLLLGHFAWFSHSHAREITEFQANPLAPIRVNWGVKEGGDGRRAE